MQSLERMVERTRAIPGVTHAAVTSQVPMGPGGNGNGLIPEGRAFHPSNVILSRLRLVTPGYFQTMKIDLVAGRDFTEADRAGALKVTIISEDAARRAWPKRVRRARWASASPAASRARAVPTRPTTR